jgi:DNA-directed RNA polymerase specialized sigma subunit
MNHEEFSDLLQGAIAGNQGDIEKLLQMYTPLINRTSFIRGKLDEDLRQYIMMHIIKNLSKFKI